MLVELQSKTTQFQPFTIQLTFQTLEEVNLFYAIFDTAPICDSLRLLNINPSTLRDALMEGGAGQCDSSDYYKKLRCLFKEWIK